MNNLLKSKKMVVGGIALSCAALVLSVVGYKAYEKSLWLEVGDKGKEFYIKKESNTFFSDTSLREYLNNTLKDSESAKITIEQVYSVSDTKGYSKGHFTLACLNVNSKNDFGAYTGYKMMEVIRIEGKTKVMDSATYCPNISDDYLKGK